MRSELAFFLLTGLAAVGSAQSPPSAASAMPNSGSGAGPQSFTYTFSDPNGATDINYTIAALSTGNNAHSCYVYYSHGANTLYLLNDNGTAFLGPVTPGSSATLSNSQCTLHAASSSVTHLGNQLTETLNLTFTPAFAGTKGNFGYVQNNAGQNSGFVQLGTWTVPAAAGGPPTAVSVSPNSGNGVGPQSFTYTFSDPNGATDINYTIAALSTGNNAHSCYVYYSHGANTLYLLNDNGTAFLGPVTPGSSATLSNSQCTLHAASSSVTQTGNQVTETLNLTFTPSFAGTKGNFGYVQNNAGQNSGFVQLGTWTVPAAAGGPPTAVSVSPNSGAGLGPQSFTYTFSDPNGAADINYTIAALSTGNNAHSCYVYYSHAANTLYLLNDNGTAFLGPVSPGSSATLSNSQCTLHAASSSVTQMGNQLTETLNLTFTPAFAGTKGNFGYVQNNAGQNSGFVQLGTWMVPN